MDYKNPKIKERLKKVKVFILDLDGTIYLGRNLFPFSKKFLEGLKYNDKDFIFLTNNSSKNANDYYVKLTHMGLDISKSQIYTSGDATIEYINKIKPSSRIYLMGTKNLEDDFNAAGFNLVDESPDFVVLGFDLTFNYEKFDIAARFIRKGIPFIATHPDLNCPLENNDMMPDCGALSAALTVATGVYPKVIGKPNKELLEGLLKKVRVEPEELCIMGDRLMTDIRFGNDFNILSVLVLTGEAGKKDLENSEYVPDLIIEKNIDLLNYL
jgi:NagD protein